MQLFGVTLPLLPVFSISNGTEGATGWLVPDISLSTVKGLELAVPFHWQIASNRDLTVTPHVYTGVLPAIELKYRDLNSLGAFQLGGFVTYGKIDNINPAVTSTRHGVRAYFEENG
jgi:LPS-assembly protein